MSPRPPPAGTDAEHFGRWLAQLAAALARLRSAADPEAPDPLLETRRETLRQVRVVLRRVRYALTDAADLHSLLATALARDELAPEHGIYSALAADLPSRTAVRREFYVYLHHAPDGAVFYVGKGRARRAWSKARTAVWRRYVDEHLHGHYTVAIHRDALTQAEALALEAELLAAHGSTLVNWVNPSRDFDVTLRERAALLRTETLGMVGTAQFLEQAAPEEALRRYRLALDDVRRYCRWPVERGLLGELQEPDRQGEPLVLDRLTRLLERLGRAREILATATEYFAEFPDAARTPAGARVRRRCERATAGKLQFGSRPVPGRARRGRVLG
jgi:hypothetical protein